MTRDILMERALAGEKLGCFIVDAHAHTGIGSYFPLYENGSAESILLSMDRYGCNITCVSAYASLHNYADYGLQDLIRIRDAFPGRFFGYISADPGYPDGIRTQLEAGYRTGFRGIKIHSEASGVPYSSTYYDGIFEFAEDRALPVLAHTWGAELKDLEPRFEQYPHIRFLLGHAGCCKRKEYARLAGEYPNAYLESCVSSSPKGLVEFFVNEGLAGKYLWGSDTNFYSQEHQIGRIIFAEIPLEDKYRILGRNAAQVLLRGTDFEKQVPPGILK